MRRSLFALSVSVLAGSALVGFAPPESSEPAAEVSPATVRPGGTLTVSVSCDPTDGPPPDSIDATSQAFDEGTVPLRLVTGNDDEVSGPAYRGTALISPASSEDDADVEAENFEGGPDAEAEDPAWSEAEGEDPATTDAEGENPKWSEAEADDPATTDAEGENPARTDVEGEDSAWSDAEGEDSAWTVDGTCPAAPGGEGTPWSATFTVTDGSAPHKPSHRPGRPPTREPCPPPPPHGEPQPIECGSAALQRGVRAGDGGAFTDSVPALVAGGVLIAGAFGAAVHRLRNRESDPYR
ncbi:hypothetical protein [Streptomyces tibetensis]|uniref:hypothetical protein n=1 Tax=Streptomyces tibetensis TaxID=2382123 RepID=UPI0033FB56C3